MSKNYVDIKQLQKKLNNFSLYKRITEAAELYRKRTPGHITEQEEGILFFTKDRMNRWEKQVELFRVDEREL